MSAYSSLVLGHANLVWYGRLGEGSGTTLNDAGPNNLDGTYAATGVTYGVADSLVNDPDTAVTFDGTGNPGLVPDNNALDLGNGPFSLECWVKRSATQSVLVQLILKAHTGGYGLAFDADNKVRLPASSVGPVAKSTATITDTSAWHHIVATKNGSSRNIYIDGVDGTELLTDHTHVDGTGSLALGSNGFAGQTYSGSMDEVAIYGAVLTPAEVLEHYRVGQGLIGYATESDSAQALDKDKRNTRAAATETDTAQALVYTKPIFKSLTPVTEIDSAQAFSFSNAESYTIASALEADTAQALTFAQAQAQDITPASETDEAQALTVQSAAPQVTPPHGGFTWQPPPLRPRIPQHVQIRPVSEVDTALPLTFTKTPSQIQIEDDELLLLV